MNGSWKYVFHNNPTYYYLVNNRVPYSLVTLFADEAEAKDSAKKLCKIVSITLDSKKTWSQEELFNLNKTVAAQSFDNSFQTGVVLARKSTTKYKVLATAHNKVVPFETYAMHHGASREINFSPPNDLNHYDTIHAEVRLLITALETKTSLVGTTLFINLLPCPSCARMLADTEIAEIVYQEDHSDGYAVKMLELAGKKVRRVVM